MRWSTSSRNRFVAPLAAACAAGLPLVLSLDGSWATQAPVEGQGPPATTAIPAYRQANVVAVLTVRGQIDGVTLHSLERRVAEALQEGAEAVVLDIDTLGGALEATLDICHLLKTEAPANTVAWIDPKAYSAGTIIALACREIVVVPNATFGDAAPISPFGPIPNTERAKLESPILAEVIHSARRNHYDEKLVQSFISVGVELWLIEHITSGQQVFVDRQEYRTVFGEEPPTQLTPVAPPAQPQGATRVKPWFEALMPAQGDSGGVPVSPQELRAQIELEQDLPSSRPRLAESDRGQWKLVKQVVANDRLLVVKPPEAITYGLTSTVIANDEQLKRYFGAQAVRRYDRNWSESLVRFLVSWPVRGVLIAVFIIALFLELAAPGMGVFGAAAGVALLVIIGAPWLAGMAQWWEIMLIGLGLILVAAELFVIPGFGVAGVAGAACMLVGIVGTFVSDDVGTPAGQSDLLAGLAATFTALFAAGIAVWLLSRQFETAPILSRFVLKAQVGQMSGQGRDSPGLLGAIGAVRRPLEPGDLGIAETDLRPAGRAIFGDRLVDVKSVGDYINRGTPLRVVSVGRFAIEVEEAK